MNPSHLSYCPRCGTKFLQQNAEHPHCDQCGYIMYQNQNLTTSAVIVRKGKLLTVRRGRDPHKGMLDLPGGFVEIRESPTEGMLRELREELHVEAKIIQILGVFGPDPYEYQGHTVYNASAHYEVDIGDQNPIAGDDASGIVWVDLLTFNAQDIAFPSERECIEEIQHGVLHLRGK